MQETLTREWTRPGASLTEVIQTMDSDTFDRWLSDTLEAGGRIMEAIRSEVHNGTIHPVQGAGLAACTYGQLLGYEDFHGVTKGLHNLQAFASPVYGGGSQKK